MASYALPAARSAAVAGLGYGAGYLAGAGLTYGLGTSPRAMAYFNGMAPAARAELFSRGSQIAGGLGGIASGLHQMAGEGYRREQQWRAWAASQGLDPYGKTAMDPLCIAAHIIAPR
jgi:hypothetical protein